MKVLWITHTLFPDVCAELGIEIPVVEGWLFSGATALLNINSDIQLAVATPYKGNKQKTLIKNGITYYLFPNNSSKGKYDSNVEVYCKEIQLQFLPDVIHIHGTELPLGLAYIKSCGNNNVIASIQGLVSVIERYYLGGIKEKNLIKNITLRDIFRQDTVFSQNKNMRLRGLLEIEMIRSIKHIIGRTSWDNAHSWAINSKINYHFCNETLRNVFYSSKWELNRCERYSIFLSQAHYPIKGLQQMIKALPIILDHFPETKIYVAGYNFVTNRGLRLNGFGKYIRSLMKENGVSQNINFMGVLSESEICKRYTTSHIFVCPSSIENSSNSIGEAQLLGLPCVASYVGGITDLINNEETGLLYRFEEVEMLAMSICRIFSDDNLAKKLSINGRMAALSRHDKNQNAKKLNEIYESLCTT